MTRRWGNKQGRALWLWIGQSVLNVRVDNSGSNRAERTRRNGREIRRLPTC